MDHILHVFFFLRREQFVQWTEKLPDSQSPSWLGLPNNAEKLLLTVQGKYKSNNLSRLLYERRYNFHHPIAMFSSAKNAFSELTVLPESPEID